MKKLFALVALVLGVVSCQTDPNDLDLVVGGEQEVMINVALAEGTRAGSADGALDNGVLDNYQLRYILEIYLGENCSRQVIYSNETTVSFPVRLAPGRAYDFVVWADFVEKGTYAEDADADLFYETSAGLDEISIIDGKPMTEARDAFYGVYNLAADKAVASISTIELKRPFAKIRVVTTDIEDLNKISVAVPTSAKITYKNDVTVYNKFNARNGEVSSDNATKEYTLSYANTYEIKDGKMTLFADYLFVPENGSTVKFDLDVTDHVSKSFNTEIPVNRNKLTTIEGDILTNGSDINVEVNPDFGGNNEWPDENNDTEKLAYAAMFGGEVTLNEDVALTQPLTIVEGAKVVINLNGKTITTNEEQSGRHHYAILNNGTLSLNGNGAINARGIKNFGTMTVDGDLTIKNVDTNGGAAIWNEGELTINNGTFISSEGATSGSYGAALNTRSGGKAVVNGGTFEAYSYLTYAIINEGETTIYDATVKGKHGAVAGAGTNDHTAIYGGTFELNGVSGQTDHCTYLVSAIYGGTFSITPDTAGDSVFYGSTIAPGYKAIEKDGKYVVVSEEVDNIVASKDDVQNALTDAVAAGETDIVIDANGANIGDLNYGLTASKIPAGTTVTIKNATVAGKSYGNGVNGTVIFDGCTFNNSGAYSIHFDNGTGEVIFRNCHLYGWNSFGSTLTSVTFENCTLEGNGTYALIRSYVDLTLTDCTIDVSNANHTDVYSEGVEAVNDATLTMTNTKYEASNNNGLKAAVAAGAEKVTLHAGNYELSDLNFVANNVTLKGVDKANVVLNLENSIYLQNKSVTLENLTYNLNAGKGYTEQAFAFVHHATAFNLKNCNVNRLRLNVYEANIEDCTFTLNTSSGFDGYCIYYYGNDNSTVNVKNSTFATAGKGICIYSESAKAYNLNVDKCSFTSSDSATDKAAIQMHTELGIYGNVKITETTATGFADINGGLWNELNNNTKVATDKFDIWVDGTQVH